MESNQAKKYESDLIGLPIENVIYCLCDPETSVIRYIGKAVNLYDRIRKHYKPSSLKGATHKNNWIKSILNKGIRPKVNVLEVCNSENALNECEIKWIAYYKSIGNDLTNGTEGGTGGKMSPESIAKMVKTKKGKKLSSSHRNAISLGNTGKHGAWNHSYIVSESHKEETRTSVLWSKNFNKIKNIL